MNAFIDTNILVYAAEERHPISRKTIIARELLLQADLHLSVQVINEFIVTARNPTKLALSPEQEAEWLKEWLNRPIVPLTIDDLLVALGIHRRFQISHWDSLIVATALSSKCAVLYTEDMQHQQSIDSLTIINPFA